MASPGVKRPSAQPPRGGHVPSVPSARGKGYSLDMSMGGPDADDADFRESA
jgi:methyl-accepting chemotaxis protein